ICLLNFKNKTPERIKVDLKLEAGINIRSWDEDWHERKYEVKFFDNKLLISSEKGFLVLSSFPFPTFEHKEIYRDHFPGGEKERVFIPGNYNISFYLGPESGHEVFFIFSPGEKEDSLKNFEKEMENFSLSYLEKEKNFERIKNNSIFKCNFEFLEKLFEASVLNLEKLWFDSKVSGYLAGYPWFLQIWVRDLAWVLPAVINYGEFEKARKSLETIFKFQSNGRIPNVIFLDGKASYNSSDSTPLALIALEHYITNSADVPFLKDIENKLEEIIEFYKKNKDENGFIFSDEKESWMDTLSREGKVLEIQAFWAKALRSCSKLFEILGNDSSELEEMALNLEKNLEKEFWNENEKFYFDRIFDSRKYGEKTLNAIFPLIFKISKNWKNVIERIESDEFTTDFGIRTISKEESLYNPSGYHTGSTWAWLVALFSAVEFLHKREKAFDYLKILSDRLERNCIYSLEEAWNSENGSIVLFKDSKIEESAYLQAWSSLTIRAIDEFMLGIRINAFENKIFVSPFLKDGMKVLRRKRIGNDWVDLIFKRKGRGAEVSYKSQKGKEYKIIKAPSLD
ncbi:MAG: amylo-alpha-1,6-glucosidase, partial [Candidatus Aenigmatarchaeota archaeon]